MLQQLYDRGFTLYKIRMCLPICREFVDFVRRLESTRRCTRERVRGESRAKREDKAWRRRYKTLTELLARQRGVLRTVCSGPLLLLSPSPSALSFSLILAHPSIPFAFPLARTFSLSFFSLPLHHSARTTRTLCRRPLAGCTIQYSIQYNIVHTQHDTIGRCDPSIPQQSVSDSPFLSFSFCFFLSRAKVSLARF